MANKQFKVSAEKIGEGNYGKVYRGSVLKNGIWIDAAIKKILYDPDDFANIKKEYALLKSIADHDHIIKILGIEIDESIVNIILELCDMDLEKYLSTEKLSLQQKIEIMHQSAGALSFIHNLQPAIVHRDVKPGNILINRKQEGLVAKITDFGFARVFDADGSKRYMNSMVGTPMYLAPEQFDSREGIKYTAAVDVFSLGLVYLVIMTCEDNPRLEPNPEILLKEDLASYAQHLLNARHQNKPMPVMFTLAADDTWPVCHLKLIINQMTAFDATHRIPMATVHQELSAIVSANMDGIHYQSSITTLKRENEHTTHLLALKCEEIATLSEKTEDLKLQLRTQDEEMLQKDQLVHKSTVKAAEKAERIHILESELANMTGILQSNTSSFNTLRKENEDKTHLLAFRDAEITTLSEKCDHNSKQIEALKLQLRKQDKEMLQKVHVINKSKVKAAEKDEKIQMLEADVARKTMILQSNTSTITKLEKRNEDNSQLLRSKDEEIDALKSQLTQKEDRISEASQTDLSESSNKSMQTGEFVTSFRHTSVDLKLFTKTNIKCVNKFTIQKNCERMCFVNSSIYCLCPDYNSLVIYSVEGKFRKEIKLKTIKYPLALHPLSEGRLVLAAESGLYEVDFEGRVMCQIMEGDFHDVHVSGHVMAVIENNIENDSSDNSDTEVDTHKSGRVDRSDRIHILSTTPPYPQSAGFSVGQTRALTVLLSEDASTVCVSARHHITTYNLSGRLMSQAGGLGSMQLWTLLRPHLCATDSNGQVLICDWVNDRLQLLSAGGEWAVMPGVQVREPSDAFVLDNYMYILHGIYDDCKISVIEL